MELWDADTDWTHYDALLIRQTWDYWDREAEFRAWLDERERAGTPMWNQPQTLRWNLNKGYLRDLAAAGIPVPETAWLPAGSEASLKQVLAEHGWRRAVVKPAVSAAGFRTHAFTDQPSAEDERIFAELLAERELMVQPFLDRVVDDGEWSVVFIDGEYSCALIKRATPGEFRVQDRHGGTVTVAEPPPRLIEQARAVLEHAPGDLLYARSDGIWDGSTFTLLELEIFEPVLFFGLVPGSAERLVVALAKRLSGG